MHHPAIARPRSLIPAHVLLLLSQRARHGYELAESLRLLGFAGVTTSLVYRELGRLEAAGLVQSFWQASQARGPARHMYELTGAGRDDLAHVSNEVRGLVAHLERFLAQLDGPDGAQPVAAVDDGETSGRSRFWKRRPG
jgi:PadR family transcriptional regulator, regulatory protein PadR